MIPLLGDPAPEQECGLLVLRCQTCGRSTKRWLPTAYAAKFGELVILMGMRCVKCGGVVKPEVDQFRCSRAGRAGRG